MRTSTVRSELWSARAKDWAAIQEGFLRPVYERVLSEIPVTPDTWFLDAGCGVGHAALAARARGARAYGLDSSEEALALARERIPEGEFRSGELESMPFPDDCFDATASVCSFQYAHDPIQALAEAKRVTRPGGKVAIVVWALSEISDHSSTFSAIGNCIPSPPVGQPGPFSLALEGVLEDVYKDQGLKILRVGTIECRMEFNSGSAAWGGMAMMPMIHVAIEHVGNDAARKAVLESLLPFRTPKGGIRQRHLFHYVVGAK
ncbi:MAG: class I SAM-dependent methyltransferase [Fimbriimonas ginsengisoli]|uniref:Class I SAM-dependent methyltransferase n=1 Tax=Fimbriimonas ginsengisoli TaxID=1005039 RepID=A0A931LT84_FIMGI|nr:class I SAM-dependent methyltransferase [Fimbriimonas ginsengisoli]MBI3721180.1 class I SAM-dependent methyltransferase [Fimbriimonas ginsengisoli]